MEKFTAAKIKMINKKIDKNFLYDNTFPQKLK